MRSSAEPVARVCLAGAGGADVISGPALLELVTRNDALRRLLIHDYTLTEEICRALSATFRMDLEITLSCCRLRGAGRAAEDAFVECLQAEGGPIKLVCTDIDCEVLGRGLLGKCCVTYLNHCYPVGVVDRTLCAFFEILAENKGLEEFLFLWYQINDENWNVLLRSVQSHATLKKITISATTTRHHSKEQTVVRIHALADMVKRNKKLLIVEMESCFEPSELALFQRLVEPHLEANRYRLHVQAIQQAAGRLLRQLLLRALQSARGNYNHFWMLLSGNADVAFPCKKEKGTAVVRGTQKRARSSTR